MPTDYMLRMFEWTDQMLTLLAKERAAGRNSAALDLIDEACLQGTGLPFDLIKRQSPEELLNLIQNGPDGFRKCLLLVDLLIEDAKIGASQGNLPDELRSTLQAYVLLSANIQSLSLDQEPAFRAKLQKLTERLSEFQDSPYIKAKLAAQVQS